MFIKQMFIRLLGVCIIGSFGESLISNLKEPIKMFNFEQSTKPS